jgi:protein-tyrosine-phosphatase
VTQAPQFRIFFVCTGNQARSPLAAAWTARALGPFGAVVGSAGTMPGRASPALAEAAALATELGLDLSRHSSSHVSAYDLSIADLVIGFEFHHVAAAVVEGGAPAAKTFLLKELIRLAQDVPPPSGPDPIARARAVIELADGLRGRGGHVHGQEIRDPAGRRRATFREIVGEVVQGCDEMTRLLFGS